MADVISVTLEANLSSKTTGAFKNFDRLVKGLGKSVLSFRKHTDSTENSVKRLNTALARKTGFADFDKKLVTSAKKVRGLKTEVYSLRDAVVKLSSAFQGFAKSTSSPLHNAHNNLQQVRKSATQTAAAYRHARTQLAGLQRQSGRSANGVRVPNVNFYGGRGGSHQAHPAYGNFGRRGTLSPTRFLQAGGSAAILGGSTTMAGSSLVGAAMGILNSGKDLEKAVQSLTARLDPQDRGIVGQLEAESRKLSKQFGILPSEIITAFEEAAAMGVTGKSLIASGSAISTLSQAGDMQSDRAAKGLGMILASYGFRDAQNNVDFTKANNLGGNLQGTGLVDLITYVAGKTQTNESEMMRAFEYSAATFKAAGIDVVKSAVYLGAASDVARTGTKGGRDMAEIIARASRSEVGKKMQDQLGVTMVDSEGNLKDTISVMAEIGLAFEQFTENGTRNQAEALNLQREFFGEQGLKAYNAFQASLKKSAELEQDIRSGKARGSAAEKAGIKSNTFHHDLIRMQGAWQAFSKAILETNRGPISTFLGMITKGLNLMTDFAKSHPVLAQTFLLGTIAAGGFLVVGGAVLTLLGTIGFAVGGIGSGLQLWSGLVGGTKILGQFGMLSRTMVLLRGGVGSLITRFPLLARVGGMLAGVFGSGAGGIAARFVALRGGLLALGASLGPVGWIITGVATAIWLLWTPIKAVAGLVWDFAAGVWNGFQQMIKPTVDELSTAFKSLWAEITPIFDELGSAWAWLANLFTPGENSARNFGMVVGQFLGKLAIPVIRMMVSGVSFLVKAMTTAKTVFHAVVGAMTSWFSPLRWIYELLKLLATTVMWLGEKVWDFGTGVWNALQPAINAFKEVLRLADKTLFYSNPLNWTSNYEEEKAKESAAVAHTGAWQKINSAGGIDVVAGPDKMKSEVFNDLVNNKTLTTQEILALRAGNDNADEFKKINFTPEQLDYMDQLQKAVNDAEAKGGKDAAQKVLNSTPTFNITVNGGNGSPEEIGASVEQAAKRVHDEYYYNQRDMFGADNSFAF